MTESENRSPIASARTLIVGLVAVIVVLGLALIAATIGGGATAMTGGETAEVNVLANSNNECVTCHERETPGIVQQYGHSTMAAADVMCEDCHEVDADYPGAVEHEDTHVLPIPTTAMCEDCHEDQVAQFHRSRHGLPAYVAYAGTDDLSPELVAHYENITEAAPPTNGARNALYRLEGEAVTAFACEQCHDIGKPAPDNSVGDCTKCHLRHEFSLEQVRKPETCNFCHIGPDHPQYEIYTESPHGIAYATGGDDWNWDAEPGTLTVEDFPAPTCATCHMSGFGTEATTHDVGERLTWYLYSPISTRRPVWQDNQANMKGVCGECHNTEFINDFYTAGDAGVEAINEWVVQSDEIKAVLADAGLLTDAPFDEPFDFEHFNLWHHWGRTAKFGMWMLGPDYTQWHGAYEVLHSMAEIEEMARDKLEEAGLDPDELLGE